MSSEFDSPGVVWVRTCGLCGRVDLRQWFPTPEDGLASEGTWRCPECEMGAGLEYTEGDFDTLFAGS